jgi:hypothetical protein
LFSFFQWNFKPRPPDNMVETKNGGGLAICNLSLIRHSKYM